MSTEKAGIRLPRENLFRLADKGVALRAIEASMPTLFGHFSVTNQWTEINSMWEGRFMERIAPGAFAKTFRENRDAIRVLFQHGRDPQIGDKPLGPLADLREDDIGAYYEVPLLDTTYNRELVPGLEAGLYGASFRFRVMREEIVEDPAPSDYNPSGLPERTIKEAQVTEAGPVTFPAYASATAGIRSLTDLILDVDAMTAATPILLDDERLNRARAFITRSAPEAEEREAEAEETDSHEETAPATDNAEESDPHLVKPARRGEPLYGLTTELPTWHL